MAHGSLYSPLVKILLGWIVALALASGHHAFYASLNNRVPSSANDMTSASLLAHSQAGASAIGTTFAFLVKASLAFSAGTAFLQCAWMLVRQRPFTVPGLDALWSSPHNAVAFLSFDFWRSARGIVLISGLAWAFPLMITFAPGTLSVESQTRSMSQPCTVPTFDFGSSTLLHDELLSASKIYARPSSVAFRVVGATILGEQPFTPTSPCDGDCSYNISASAPSFSCSPGATALTWTLDAGPDYNPPPYVANNLDVTPSKNDYAGWDFEAHFSDYSEWFPVSGGGSNITCVAYNSTYHLNYTFVGSTSSVTINQIVPQQPGSQISPNTTANDYGYFLPNSTIHSGWFNATTNYYAVLSAMYSYFVGNITVTVGQSANNFVYNPSSNLVTDTGLLDTEASAVSNGNLTWRAHPDFSSAMETLLQNITLSILTGSLDATQTASTTCVLTDKVPHFEYNARRLWLVYGLGLGVALLCDLVGIFALYKNSGGANGGFSDFLAATRNPELNGLDLRQPARIRLQYGPVRSEGGRYAFAKPESLCEGGAENDAQLLHRDDDGGEKSTPFLPEQLYDNSG
ncbi:hypothetical protein B0H12DRAFT_23675 [Mycena haematopus]|nr:hypothetical protein B0H12DRAFT_23675 [Mycena haematopus]